MVDPALEPEADNGCGSLNGKKDKKKGKKTLVEEQHEETETGEKETNVGADFGWGNFDTVKKNRKKVNVNSFGMQVSESIVEKEPDPENDIGFDFGGKKGKKPKKGAAEDFTKIEPAVTVVPEVELGMDDDWGTFGSKKDKKKGKKGTAEDATKSDKVNAVQALDLEPFDNASWESTTKNDKKGKKDLFSEGQEDPLVTAGHEADAHTVGVDDDWMNGWGSADKKGKKGKKVGPAIEAQKLDQAPPPPLAEPEPSTFDPWGTATKAKKGRKGKTVDSDPPIVTVPDQSEENVDPLDVEFGGWGLSAKDKKKKEKEKKDIEAREKAEREEKEKVEKEQAEQEEKESAEKDRAKIKTKSGKKSKAVATETSKTKDLMADSVPDFAPAAVEEVSWGMWAGSAKKDKTKGGKNALPGVPPPVPTPPAQGLTPEPESELIPGLDDVGDDDWASFAPAKSKGKKDGNTAFKSTKAGEAKTAKKSSKDKAEYSPTEPYQDDFKKKESPKDESAAKATKSLWGGVGTTSTAKSKNSKAQDAEKPKDLMGLDDLLDDEVIGITDEPAVTSTKKGVKTKGNSKLGSKDFGIKKNSDDALVENLPDVGDEQLASVMDEAEGMKEDAWSFWGGPKKTGGKKADELPKEITKPVGANQKGSLKNNFNHLKKEKEPESAAIPADEASQSQPSKASKHLTMSAPKSTTKSSVLQRVKDFEKERDKGSGKAKEKTSEATAEPQLPAPEIFLEPLSKAESAPPQKSFATGSKPKGSKTDTKKKAPSPPAAQEKEISTVPGSFPGEGLDDHLLDLLDAHPVERKPAQKPIKSKKEPKKESVMDMMDDFDFDAPVAEPLPTPPPEPVAAKPAKKERARVVKNEGASSWGFWGATPKKDVKKDVSSKDDAELPPPKPKEKKPTPGLSRSKSTKTVKEKDKEMEKSSRSSGSDEKEKKSESRPSKSRGSSFGGFFGGPPPVRAKTVRRNSTAASKTASSRRPSIDVDAIGLPSPPAGEAPEMGSKAAKLMGTAKVDMKASTRGKQKAKGSANSEMISEDRKADANAVVPDPYAIDDDDMVMVGGYDGPALDDAPRQETPARGKKEKPPKSNSKKEVSATQQQHGEPTPPIREKSIAKIVPSVLKRANHGRLQIKPSPEVVDDVVMVEAGSPKDDLDGGPKETLAFDERPRPQRSTTSAKKPKGSVMGGLFGFGKSRRASETFERPRSKGVVTDDEGIARRKRTVAGGGDSAKRLRRDDRRVRRSDREDRAAEGYVYDLPADGGAVTGAEDDEARRERNTNRITAREADLKDAEDHRARRRDAERAAEDARKLKAKAARDRRARKEEEAEAVRLEEKRARRAARAEMNAKLATAEPSPRPTKSSRRRSHIDQPMASGATDDTERRVRRDARRAARTPGEKSNRRNTTAPVDDYFDPRNGVNGQEPYLHGANDHTSSWVKSQISDPAPPPPVEGTVIEPTPVLGGAHDTAIDEDAARRSKRKSRRQSRYVEMTPEEEEARRRRKDREIRSSEESRDDDGGRPYTSRRKSDFVGGIRGFDARPSLAANGKRGSWLKRVSGF